MTGLGTSAAFFEGLDVVGAPRELVALGGTTDVPTLVAAYRAGCFPWPSSGPHRRSLDRHARRLARSGSVPLLPGSPDRGPLLPWCSPQPRAVLLADQVVVSRSLRSRLRRSGWTTTVDAAFADVVQGCADREETWITAGMQDGYRALHVAGVAHSLEVWEGEELVGGLYGVLTGRVFSGESMFHRRPDASKVALVDLCARLREAGVLLVDTQQETEHMLAMGQVLVDRGHYLELVRRLRDDVTALDGTRRPAARLA